MSLKLRKLENHLEVLEGDLPGNKEFRVFTEEEVLQFEGWKQWMSLSEEQRDDMMLQTQSAAYKEWMDDGGWDDSGVEESLATYGKGKVKQSGMNTQIKAHIDSGNLILDEPLPPDFEDSEVLVSIKHLSPNSPHPRPEERLQSESGFARTVLLDSSEDVWDHE